jgi:hypothetical protein
MQAGQCFFEILWTPYEMKDAHLLGEFDAARFPDDGHSNLSGILQIIFDFPDNFSTEFISLFV